jgi:phosphopantetheinyl transferase
MPIVWSQNLAEKGKIAIWEISETDQELYNMLQLDEKEEQHFQTLSKARQKQWLGSRVLLRTLLQTEEHIELIIDEHRKPFLNNFPFEIAISHANHLAAVIIYEGKKVGVDIEKISERILKIKNKFLSSEELNFIAAANELEQLHVCWGVKESLFKLYGKGSLPFIDGIKIAAFEYDKTVEVAANIAIPAYQANFNVQYLKYEDFMLTWVIE